MDELDEWDRYDGWEEDPPDEDPDEGYDRMRQYEVDDEGLTCTF